MKLRTKISMIAAAVILAAAAVSDGIIWTICRRMLIREADQNACRRVVEISAALENYSSSLGSSTSDSAVFYYLKSQGDAYTVCIRNGEEVYNQTVLTPDELMNAEKEPYPQPGAERFWMTKNGVRLLISHTRAIGIYDVFCVTDTGELEVKLQKIALGMTAVLFGITIPAVLLLYVLVRRSLRPMKQLSEQAKAIAAGAYDQRAATGSNDETGQLARDFNTMAEAVEDKIAALTESEQKKTMFMADFSHELKTPLTAISGYAQTLRAVKLSDEDRDAALRYICTESARLDRLAKKMMRLLELDTRESLQFEEVSLGALMQAAQKTCQPAAEQKGVTVTAEPGSGTVQGDFDLLHDVLCNLVDNAVKASGEGQTVRLYESDGDLYVADSGCGIPAAELKNITEPFYMVDKSRSRRSGGAGLGLALAAQIVRLHHAELRFESEVGRGTCVCLHFV